MLVHSVRRVPLPRPSKSKIFELPPHIEVTPVVLQHFGSVGSLHGCFGNSWRGRSHRGELHRGSGRGQAAIGVEGRPLAEMRRVGKRLPDFFRGVTELSDEDKRPLPPGPTVPAGE
jgi:hypothetical protein